MTSPHLNRFFCFDLEIHGYSPEDAWSVIEKRIADGASTTVVTTNAEILLYAHRHSWYWRVLEQAHVRLVDSFGLHLVGLMLRTWPQRTPGAEFADRVLQKASRRGWRVALIGGQPGVALKAARHIHQKYPNLVIQAEQGGIIQTDGAEDAESAALRVRLAQFAPDVLLVAFGHPKQEAWMSRHVKNMPSVKIAVGIGGILDIWAGKLKRAPRCMQVVGLEWAWRLIQEPRRWRRILDAVVFFPCAVIAHWLNGVFSCA